MHSLHACMHACTHACMHAPMHPRNAPSNACTHTHARTHALSHARSLARSNKRTDTHARKPQAHTTHERLEQEEAKSSQLRSDHSRLVADAQVPNFKSTFAFGPLCHRSSRGGTGPTRELGLKGSSVSPRCWPGSARRTHSSPIARWRCSRPSTLHRRSLVRSCRCAQTCMQTCVWTGAQTSGTDMGVGTHTGMSVWHACKHVCADMCAGMCTGMRMHMYMFTIERPKAPFKC